MNDKADPIREADDAARALARDLLNEAVTASLGVIDPDTGAPFVSRIAFGLDSGGRAMTLISDLAHHARALRAEPRASLLLGEPGSKGDPLIHPRLTLQVTARFLAPDAARRAELRAIWLRHHPKAKLYIDFADFHFVHFDIEVGLLIGGFAKAYALRPNDLTVAAR